MATIITKNSSTASAVPSAGSLTKGELAVNVTDKKLYTKDNGGNVVVVGQEPLISGTNIKTVNSNSLLGSGNVAVQDVLVSGTNIKTVDGNSLLGSGNIDLVAPGSVTTSGLTMNTSTLLGRTTAASGAIEEITVGAGLSLSGGSLTVAPIVPRLISTSTAEQTTATTTLVINAPSGIVSGDLMLCLIASDTNVSWTGDTGWTESLDDSYIRVARKTATGSEPASYTFTASLSTRSSGCIIVLRNASFGVQGTVNTTGSAPIANKITPAAIYSLLFAFVTSSNNTTSIDAPVNFHAVAKDDGGANPSYTAFVQQLIGAVQTKDITFTSNGTNGKAVLLSVSPA